MRIELGWIVKDKISGIEGVVTSRTEYMNKCIRLGVTPTGLDKDKKPYEAIWIDEEQLSVLRETSEYLPNNKDYSGGPERPVPPQRSHP